jgi:hypothetical protein
MAGRYHDRAFGANTCSDFRLTPNERSCHDPNVSSGGVDDLKLSYPRGWVAPSGREQEKQMAAVTIIDQPRLVPRHRTGPTTRPRRRVRRAVYLRRRIAAAVLGMGLVLVMAQAGAALGGSSLAAPERRPASQHSVVVRPGDSLWAVATRLAPGQDPRPVVDALAEARHGTPLVPGERVEWDG